MAFALDATVGGTTSNSYITVADADDYFAGVFNADDWNILTETEKAQLLVMSTRRLDAEKFYGQRENQTQKLQWPRLFVNDRDGYVTTTTTLPVELQYATCEYALYQLRLENREVTESMREDFSRVKIGPLEYEIRDTRKGDVLPNNVQTLLKAIGPSMWMGGSTTPSSFRR